MLAILNSTHFSGSNNYRAAAAGSRRPPSRPRRTSDQGPHWNTRSSGWGGSPNIIIINITIITIIMRGLPWRWPPRSSSRAPSPRLCTWGWAPCPRASRAPASGWSWGWAPRSSPASACPASPSGYPDDLARPRNSDPCRRVWNQRFRRNLTADIDNL